MTLRFSHHAFIHLAYRATRTLVVKAPGDVPPGTRASASKGSKHDRAFFSLNHELGPWSQMLRLSDRLRVDDLTFAREPRCFHRMLQ